MGDSPAKARSKPSHRRAFTLIELLVVIFIIVLLIGILLPALTGAGRAARGAKTKAIMRDVVAAVDQFQIDQRRSPGHFSQVDMGAQENADGSGFTQMENALLDLAGGVVEKSGSTEPGANNQFRDVGPFNDDDKNVRVDRTLVGDESQGAYLSLDADTLTPAFGQADGSGSGSGIQDITPRDMPDVIDAFVTPVMMWTRDVGGANAIRAVTDFASEASDTGKALFYWNTNAGYLNAFSLNGSTRQQRTDSALGGEIERSLRERNLTAVLGSPAFPTPGNRSLPAQPRGSVILISAGRDTGYFALGGEPGNRRVGYGTLGFSPNDSQSSEAGEPVDTFDDIILSTGG